MREHCFALADSLFRSIGAQLTVKKHHGEPGRGNFIDHIDLPLNDASWLLGKLSEVDKLTDEDKRLQEIEKILNRNNPGPGGFYDNFGSPKSWERVKSDISWEKDPGGIRSPRVGYGLGLYANAWMNYINARDFESKFPLSWMIQIATLHDQPLKIVYDNLDPKGSYTIRIAYTGPFKSTIKMVADGILIHDLLKQEHNLFTSFRSHPKLWLMALWSSHGLAEKGNLDLRFRRYGSLKIDRSTIID